MELEFIAVGKLTKVWGNKGELIIYPLTNDPKRLLDLKNVFLFSPNKKRIEKIVVSVRFHNRDILIKFEGVDDIATAGRYKNWLVQIHQSESPQLEEDEFYWHDLMGCEVKTKFGDRLGKVSDIWETGSNDVLVVKNHQKEEFLIPFIADVVLEVDIAKKMIIIDPIIGLLSDEDDED